MSRKKKITDDLKPQIAEALKTKSRTQVCQDFGVSFEMLRREFGKAWTKGSSAIERKVEEMNEQA